jgi:hypothetical protein
MGNRRTAATGIKWGQAKWWVIAALAGAFLVLLFVCDHSQPAAGVDAPRQVAVRGDEMIIQGHTDAALSAAVEATLKAPHAPITTLFLASLGGEEDEARMIAEAVARLGPRRIVVPPGFACESACLLIALVAGPHFEPADNATLMFHRSWLTGGPQRCLACQPLNWLSNVAQDRIQGPERHREMQTWADFLAPGLGRRLAACKPNPFDTLAGVTITGLAFKRFRAGDREAITCRSGL